MTRDDLIDALDQAIQSALSTEPASVADEGRPSVPPERGRAAAEAGLAALGKLVAAVPRKVPYGAMSVALDVAADRAKPIIERESKTGGERAIAASIIGTRTVLQPAFEAAIAEADLTR